MGVSLDLTLMQDLIELHQASREEVAEEVEQEDR